MPEFLEGHLQLDRIHSMFEALEQNNPRSWGELKIAYCAKIKKWNDMEIPLG